MYVCMYICIYVYMYMYMYMYMSMSRRSGQSNRSMAVAAMEYEIALSMSRRSVQKQPFHSVPCRAMPCSYSARMTPK